MAGRPRKRDALKAFKNGAYFMLKNKQKKFFLDYILKMFLKTSIMIFYDISSLIKFFISIAYI
jgi:hypothetical protein